MKETVSGFSQSKAVGKSDYAPVFDEELGGLELSESSHAPTTNPLLPSAVVTRNEAVDAEHPEELPKMPLKRQVEATTNPLHEDDLVV